MAVDIKESNKNYKDEIKLVTDEMNKDEWLSTPELAEESHTEDYKWNYWRYQLVPGVLNYLYPDDIAQKKEHEGGEATHYWRLK